MPLFPRVPAVKNPDDPQHAEGGGGYQWIVNKFVQLAEDIRNLREASEYTEDKGEYRRLAAIAKELDNPSPEALPAITISLGVVPPGTIWELERVVTNANAAAAALTVLILSGQKRGMDTIIDASAGNVNQTSYKGFVREYQNKIVLREGMELIVRYLSAEVAELPVEATAFVRAYPEKPSGLAVD